MNLRIKSDAQLDISTAFDLIRQIGEIVEDYLLSVFNTIAAVTYEVELIADTRLHDNITTSEIATANLLWFEITTKLKINTPHDPEERLKALLSKETRFTLSTGVNVSSMYITLIVRDVLMVQEKKIDFGQCSPTFIVFDLCLEINKTNTVTKFLKSRDNYTVVPIYGNYQREDLKSDKDVIERNILEYRECVFVQVKKNDTEWQDTDYGLQFTRAGMFLPFSEFIYGDKHDVIWVCLETYNALHNSGARNLVMSYVYIHVCTSVLLQYYTL